MLAWDANDPPPTRRPRSVRYYRTDGIRTTCSLAAFALPVAALGQLTLSADFRVWTRGSIA